MKLLPLQLSLLKLSNIRTAICLLNQKTDSIRILCDTYYEDFIELLRLNQCCRTVARAYSAAEAERLDEQFDQAIEAFNAMYHQTMHHFLANLFTDIDALEVRRELQSEIKGIALVMARKLLNWCYRIKRTFNTFPPTIWKSDGTIDEDETLELMLNNEELDFLTRFQIACYCCKEDRIKEMWPDVPDSYKLQCEQAMTADIFCEDFEDLFLPKSVWYNAVRKNQSLLQTMLAASLHTSNWMGVKYFWANLNQQYRQQFLTGRSNFIRRRMVLLPRTHENCDTICRFYWLILNESDRIQADKAFLPYACFNMLLMWPFHQHLENYVRDHKDKFAMAAIGEYEWKISYFFMTNPMRTMGVYHRACNELYEVFAYNTGIPSRRFRN